MLKEDNRMSYLEKDNRFILKRNRILFNSENSKIADSAKIIEDTQLKCGSAEEIADFARNNCRINRKYLYSQYLLGISIGSCVLQEAYCLTYNIPYRGVKLFVYPACILSLILLVKKSGNCVDNDIESLVKEINQFRIKKQLNPKKPREDVIVERDKAMDDIIMANGYNPYSLKKRR